MNNINEIDHILNEIEEKETQKYLTKYEETTYNNKEDLIFELLLYILMNQLHRRGIENTRELEDSYRKAYKKLPYFYEKKHMEEYTIKELNLLDETIKNIENIDLEGKK